MIRGAPEGILRINLSLFEQEHKTKLQTQLCGTLEGPGFSVEHRLSKLQCCPMPACVHSRGPAPGEENAQQNVASHSFTTHRLYLTDPVDPFDPILHGMFYVGGMPGSFPDAAYLLFLY